MSKSPVKVSITIPPEILEKIDTWAGELGLSRSAMIQLALRVALEEGDKVFNVPPPRDAVAV